MRERAHPAGTSSASAGEAAAFHARDLVRLRGRVVSALDRQRLYDSVPFTIPMPGHVAELLQVLQTATPVEPTRVPHDLVTMNSVVRVWDVQTGEPGVHQLVYPFDAEIEALGRSVTAPFGASLFGRHVGEHFVWETPRGPRWGIVEALSYQPERAGHFDR